MLVIPEHQSIIIMPPRTGSSTIHAAVSAVSPSAFMLYRHAEADAIPEGYQGFRVTGFVRHPLARMWSLFKFCATLDPRSCPRWTQEEVLRIAESVQGRTFENWLVNNTELFLPQGHPNPQLFQMWYLPETRKSQFVYLRPDLGTEVLPFSELDAWLDHVGLPAMHENQSPPRPLPPLTPAIEEHLERYFPWEMRLGLSLDEVFA